MKDIVSLIKWIANRPFYLKKEIVGFYEKLIYQKQSRFLLHNWNAHRCPYQAVLFYSFIGRVGFALKEVIALLSGGKIFQKSIKLDGFDMIETKTKTQGSHDKLWPRSIFVDEESVKIEDAYFKKIENSLKLARVHYHDNLDKTEDWDVVSEKFQTLLFDEKGVLQREALINFRANHSFENIIADTFKQVDTTERYMAAYLKAIDVVCEYHRSAKVVKKEILASLSESYAGGSTCVHYRGLRLSEKLFFYAVATQDIVEYVTFSQERRSVVLDIGTGYGALPAILKNYHDNACYILVDLPEVIAFASYYIKALYPDKKIALLEDVGKDLEDFDTLVQVYDFILLPAKAIEEIPAQSVDLVINTASLGFLSQEYLDYFLTHIDRVLKVDGYFYSINKTETCQWGIGMYEWKFKGRYLTLLLEYNNRFSYPQWLGKKIDK